MRRCDRQIGPAAEFLEQRRLFDATPPLSRVVSLSPVEGRGFEYIDVLVAYSEARPEDGGVDRATLGWRRQGRSRT